MTLQNGSQRAYPLTWCQISLIHCTVNWSSVGSLLTFKDVIELRSMVGNGGPVLSLSRILSLDWNFRPFFRNFLGIYGFFRNFRKSMKMRKMKFFSLFWKSYLVLFLTLIIALRCYVAPLVYHAGCKRAPKSFGLVKIRKKSVEIWAKSLKTFTKSLKIWANPWKYEQEWRTTPLKITWRAFVLEVTFYGVFFRQVWENSGKNP